MSTRTLLTHILLAAGLALAAGGLVLGLLPKTAAGAYGPVNCGSAFHGSSAATVDDYQATLSGDPGVSPLGSTAAACAAARSNAKTAPIVLLVIGGGLLAGGIVTAALKERSPAAEKTV